MSADIERVATQPLVKRILGVAGCVTIVAGAIAGIAELTTYLPNDESELAEAEQQIKRYEQEVADHQVKVGLAVMQAFEESEEVGVPQDCAADKTAWSEACHEASERWQRIFVGRLNAEAAADILVLAQHFRLALDCVASGRCHESTIRSYFEPKICEFWQKTFPYIRFVAVRGISDAGWLVEYCDGERCRPAGAEI
jgi:hypothetical protein